MAPKLRVAFFFVLSGIVLFIAHGHELGQNSSAVPFLRRRFLRIYPLYWFVLALVVAAQFATPASRSPGQLNPWVLLSSALLVHVHTAHTNMAVAWSLFPEIEFYIFFALILFHKRLGSFIFALWMFGCTLNIFGMYLLPPSFFSPIDVLFGLGLLCGWLIQRSRAATPKTLFAVGCLILGGTLLYSAVKGESNLGMFLCAGLGSAAAMVGAAQLEKRGQLRVWSPLNSLGAASYSIFLIHFSAISMVARIGFRLDHRLHWPLFVWTLILVISGLASGFALNRLVERPLLKWTKGLYGPRNQRPSHETAAATFDSASVPSGMHP